MLVLELKKGRGAAEQAKADKARAERGAKLLKGAEAGGVVLIELGPSHGQREDHCGATLVPAQLVHGPPKGKVASRTAVQVYYWEPSWKDG